MDNKDVFKSMEGYKLVASQMTNYPEEKRVEVLNQTLDVICSMLI